MKRIALFAISGCLLLSACASKQSPEAGYRPATQFISPVVPRASAPTISTAPKLIQLKAPTNGKKLTGAAAIQVANKKSTLRANSSQYTNAIMNFDFTPGALYQIYCAPLAVTDIQFEAGETIVSVAAGDTLRWQVSKSYSGSEAGQCQHILVKPIDKGLTNTMVITTNLRTYHLVLYSTNKTYMASVQWQYPNDDNGLVTQDQTQPPASRDDDISQSLNLNKMNFSYNIALVKGPVPSWMPIAIFTDNNKTYIQFPKNIQEAPTLFIGENAEITNYRVVGDYYVIDGILDNAELVGGHTNPSVVKIYAK